MLRIKIILTIFMLGMAVVSCDKTDLTIEEEEEVLTDDDQTTDEETEDSTTTESTKLYIKFNIETTYNPNIYENVAISVTNDDMGNDVNSEVISSTPYLTLTYTTNAEEVLVGTTPQISGETLTDFTEPVEYTLKADDGETVETFTLNLTIVDYSVIPHIYITVDDGSEVLLKEYYDATIWIDGGSDYDDLEEVTTRIKGRGNSTWSYPKKPYKLKLDSKASIFGLTAAKEWVLLANYIDPTLMLNSMAMKAGAYLDVPHVNHMLPVDVTINGQYKGSYTFTEQIEINEGRVDLSDEGYILELDTYMDEDYKQYSSYYSLPVMLKDGDVNSDAEFQVIMDEFNELEALIASATFPNNGYKDVIDIESVASFMLVNQLMENLEVTIHPKSTYIHKDVNSKFVMGPIWDFDWTCGYEFGSQHFSGGGVDIFSYSSSAGITKFFNQFFKDPEFVAIYQEKWSDFVTNNKLDFFEYAEEYYHTVTPSYNTNAEIWTNHSPTTFSSYYNSMITWFENRITYVTGLVNNR
ncbi:MAG: CotH kinase family protein [Rikenellaceae bacterium]